MALLTKKAQPQATESLPGLTGTVARVTGATPALAALYEKVLDAGQVLGAAQLDVATCEDGQRRARDGDLLQRLSAEREVRAARAAVAEREREVRAARERWSQGVIEALRPMHRDQIRRKADLLEQNSAAEQEHADLIGSLRDSGVVGFAGPLRPMHFAGAALRLDHPYSTATLWMAEARSFGLLD